MNKKGKLKISLISEYYYPVSNAPSARFKPLVEELSKFFDVRIYTSRLSREYRSKKLSCNVIPFPDNTRGIAYRLIFELMYSIETFIRLLFIKSDYYYITSPSFFNCIASACYCTVFNKKYIVDVRDDYPRVFFDTGLIKEHSLVGRFLSWVEKKIYDNSYLVVAATEGLFKNIRKVYDGELYLLRNGFSESVFIYNAEKYPIFTLVLHGNLSSFQGIDIIIELGKLLEKYDHNVQILVIGKGSDDYKLQNCTTGTIKYLGPKPHHEIASIIQKAHIGLSLRKGGKISEDAFPVRAYEYIGVCIPILVTPISEAGHHIEQLKIGYQFEPEQVSAMVNIIEELMNNKELYHSLVNNLKENRKNFSRELQSADFVKFLVQKIKV